MASFFDDTVSRIDPVTAEVVGVLSTQAGGVRPATLAESGAEMSAWMEERLWP